MDYSSGFSNNENANTDLSDLFDSDTETHLKINANAAGHFWVGYSLDV